MVDSLRSYLKVVINPAGLKHSKVVFEDNKSCTNRTTVRMQCLTLKVLYDNPYKCTILQDKLKKVETS